jgi:pumilio homology domain family member 6
MYLYFLHVEKNIQIAVGGADKILQPLSNKIDALHEVIASLAAAPKDRDSEEEHVFENFHSSRTIRKLVLDSHDFASALWKGTLEGKTNMWAQGHRYVLSISV